MSTTWTAGLMVLGLLGSSQVDTDVSDKGQARRARSLFSALVSVCLSVSLSPSIPWPDKLDNDNDKPDNPDIAALTCWHPGEPICP